MARLERTLTAAIPGLSGGWRDPDEAAEALDAVLERRTLLVLDDFHLLRGSSGETALEHLLRHAPSLLSVLIRDPHASEFQSVALTSVRGFG